MPTAIIIASKKTPMRPADGQASADYGADSGKPYMGKESASEESAEESAKYSVEVPLEGEEIEANAPDGVDLAEVPQTGKALVDYTLQCAPDGSSCKVILGKICFAGGDDENAAEDAAEGGEDGETGELGAKPGGIADALRKAMGDKNA